MTEFIYSPSFQTMLKDVQSFPIPHDFTFFVGNNAYQIYKLFACMISPAVLHALQSDATIEEFQIDSNCDKQVFSQIINIFSGTTFQITDSNVFDAYKIAAQLQNNDLIEQCKNLIFQNLNDSNIFQNIESALTYNVPSEPFIRYIASNFENLASNEKLFDLPIDILLTILKQTESSSINSSWFVQWVLNAVENHGEKYSILIEAIKLNELEYVDICQILKKINSTNMTSEICLKLKSLFIDILSTKPGWCALKDLTVEYQNRNDQLRGIIDKLTSKYGNVIEKGFVKVLVPCNNQMACDLLNYTNHLNQHWKNESNPDENWIIFDFKRYKINLTAYTIRGCYCSDFQCRPKAWTISGSNDKETWTNLSEIKNCTQINKPYGMMTFDVPNSKKSYRYIRYTQLENNAKKLPYIVHLSAFEFFGTITKIP